MEMCPICEKGILIEDKESLDSGFCSFCGEMSYFQDGTEVIITRENINKYYKFMSKEDLGKLGFNILITDRANKAIRNYCADAYIDNKGKIYSFDDNKKDLKLRVAVELCEEDEDGDVTYGLDYEYFNTEEDANNFIKNTVLIPTKINEKK